MIATCCWCKTLAHYAYLVFGKTLAKASDLGYTFEESLRYSTPPYSILAAFTSRIIGGNPDLYAQIQGQADSDALRADVRRGGGGTCRINSRREGLRY